VFGFQKGPLHEVLLGVFKEKTKNLLTHKGKPYRVDLPWAKEGPLICLEIGSVAERSIVAGSAGGSSTSGIANIQNAGHVTSSRVKVVNALNKDDRVFEFANPPLRSASFSRTCLHFAEGPMLSHLLPGGSDSLHICAHVLKKDDVPSGSLNHIASVLFHDASRKAEQQTEHAVHHVGGSHGHGGSTTVASHEAHTRKETRLSFHIEVLFALYYCLPCTTVCPVLTQAFTSRLIPRLARRRS
jgi:hypothetical protein